MSANTCFLFSGATAFLIFLAASIVLRIGQAKAPFRALCVLHLFIFPVYGFTLILCIPGPLQLSANLGNVLIGAYVYIALHYAFFAHFFGQISRGFSMNICTLIYARGGCAQISDILRSYAGGVGIDYVFANRIQVMKETRAIVEDQHGLTLSAFGRLALKLNRILLNIWGLDYIRETRERKIS